MTGRDAGRFNFKVQTLRKVELTCPYFHDGEAATPEASVDIMVRLQLGRQYTSSEIGSIVALLKTLTSDRPWLRFSRTAAVEQCNAQTRRSTERPGTRGLPGRVIPER